MTTPNIPLDPRVRRFVTIGLMTGMFLAALEATVVSTAMPTVIAALGGLEHYSWVFSAYLLTSTVSVPVWGKLSDVFGRRVLYQIAVIVFLLGSALSGAAWSMGSLIGWRALQGLGAGGLVPLGMTVIGDIYTLEERGKMQAYFSGVWGLASILGPLVGGLLTDGFSWRAVFYINIPFGIAAAIIIGRYLKEPQRHFRPRVDYAGAITFTTAVTLLMLVFVDERLASGRLTTEMIAMAATAVVLMGLFVWIERHAEDPMIPLPLFLNRTVSVTVSGGLLIGAGMFGALSYIPLWAQGVKGTSATEAGSMLTPLMLSWVVVSSVAGRYLLRVGFRWLVLSGCALLVASFFAFATFGAATSRWLLVLDLAAMGAGMGLTMLTLLIAVQHGVERHQLGVATSLNQFTRTIGGAMGVALMGALITASLAASGVSPDDTAALMMSREGAGGTGFTAERAHLADALRQVFVFGGVTSLIALVVCALLPERDAQSSRGRASTSSSSG